MYDKFVFSDAQALATLDSTGVISSNYWDLEYDDSSTLIRADQQVTGWLNVILTSIANTGGDEGMYIWIIESDSTDGSTPSYLGGIRLLQAEIATGNQFSIGVNKKCSKRYMSVWYMAVSRGGENFLLLQIVF